MNLVVDTNVLMSGIFFGGLPGRALEKVLGGRWRMVATPSILNEYRRITTDLNGQFPGIDARPVIEVLAAHALVLPGRRSSSLTIDRQCLARNGGCWRLSRT